MCPLSLKESFQRSCTTPMLAFDLTGQHLVPGPHLLKVWEWSFLAEYIVHLNNTGVPLLKRKGGMNVVIILLLVLSTDSQVDTGHL